MRRIPFLTIWTAPAFQHLEFQLLECKELPTGLPFQPFKRCKIEEGPDLPPIGSPRGLPAFGCAHIEGSDCPSFRSLDHNADIWIEERTLRRLRRLLSLHRTFCHWNTFQLNASSGLKHGLKDAKNNLPLFQHRQNFCHRFYHYPAWKVMDFFMRKHKLWQPFTTASNAQHKLDIDAHGWNSFRLKGATESGRIAALNWHSFHLH